MINLTKKTLILLICCALLIVTSIVIAIVRTSSDTEHDQLPNNSVLTPGKSDHSQLENPENIGIDVLLGDWYSSREKGDHLVLNKDGTMSSDWLGTGTYQLSGTNLTLVGTLNLTVSLQYDPVADTLFFSGTTREDPHTYYRSEALLKDAIETQREKDASSDAVSVAREMLTSGPWEASLGDKVFMRVDFTDNTITYNYYTIKKEIVYNYSIERAAIDTGELTIFIAYADQNDTEGKLLEATIVINATGDGNYHLRETGLGWNTVLDLNTK